MADQMNQAREELTQDLEDAKLQELDQALFSGEENISALTVAYAAQ